VRLELCHRSPRLSSAAQGEQRRKAATSAAFFRVRGENDELRRQLLGIPPGGLGNLAASLVTVTPAAKCSVTFDTDPILRGNSTTVRWTSANASTLSCTALDSSTYQESTTVNLVPAYQEK
jgi:hypothetical protein